MTDKPVKLYTLSTCSHCKSTKKFLNECTIQYEFVDVDLLEGDERKAIIEDIEEDFTKGLEGIKRLPLEARFGVFMAYRYYNKLLDKLKKTPALKIKSTRIRVPNYRKVELLTRSYVKYQLNLL